MIYSMKVPPRRWYGLLFKCRLAQLERKHPKMGVARLRKLAGHLAGNDYAALKGGNEVSINIE